MHSFYDLTLQMGTGRIEGQTIMLVYLRQSNRILKCFLSGKSNTLILFFFLIMSASSAAERGLHWVAMQAK